MRALVIIIAVVSACFLKPDPKSIDHQNADAQGGSHDSQQPSDGGKPIDGKPTVDGRPIDGKADARPIDAPLPPSDAPYACQQTGGGALYNQCCVFSAGVCNAGTYCYWQDYNFQRTQPSQDGGCFPAGTVSVGSACPDQVACVPGAWCAPYQDVKDGSTADTCRTLCDPNNLGANGCPSGQTCHKMPYCPDPANAICSTASEAHVGYCK